MKTRVIVCGIIINPFGDLLLGKKEPNTPPYPNTWLTLGGGVEDTQRALKLLEQSRFNDPYLHDELRREMHEEAGIEISDPQNICPQFRALPREALVTKRDGDYRLLFLEYICATKNSAFVASAEIPELRWFGKHELDSLEISPPSREMYREIGFISSAPTGPV